MMSHVIVHETQVFLLSVLLGAAMTFLYDLIRSLRRAFLHGLAAVSVEDFLFWLAAAFCTFCLAFSQTDGVIRGYVAVGIGLGAVFYHYTASPLVIRFLSWLLKLVRRCVRRIWRIVSKPVRIFCQKWNKMIEIARKKGYNKKQKRNERKLRGEQRETIHKGNLTKRGKRHGTRKKTAEQK